MLQNYSGIIIGGIIPVFLFGLSGLFLKTCSRTGVSLNYYLLFSGVGVLFVGLLSFVLVKENFVNCKSAFYSSLVGALWGGGAVCMALGLVKYHVPVSVLAPIAATNSLVTVLLGFLIYAEWRDVDVVRLLIGGALIIAGGILVAQSQ